MTKLHLVEPSNTVVTTEYTGQLFGKMPELEVIRQMIGCKYAEHVNVLWQGKHCHMFVDEDGHRLGLVFNPKATRIYWNATIQRLKKPELIYANLHKPGYFTKEEAAGIETFLANAAPIVGKAVLWEGELE